MSYNTNNVPASWSEDDIVEGLDILDKAELLDTPFRILGAVFKANNDGISICYLDAERSDGTQFTFLDSSTGVRAQVLDYLKGKGLDAGVDTEEYIEFRLVAPNGLRKSEYDTPVRGANGQPIPGKFRHATTYYLTTSGQRNARSHSKPVETAPKAVRTTK
jgi:hypothetical protein